MRDHIPIRAQTAGAPWWSRFFSLYRVERSSVAYISSSLTPTTPQILIPEKKSAMYLKVSSLLPFTSHMVSRQRLTGIVRKREILLVPPTLSVLTEISIAVLVAAYQGDVSG